MNGRLYNNTFFWVLITLLLSLLTRVSLLDAPLVDDEFFHVLVAESWLEDRELSMLDGIYTRGAFFTKLVAISYALFGEVSWEAARIFPSVLTGVLLVGLITWWVHREVGPVAAASTAILLIFWPAGIEVSQFVRFYALHGFLFCVGAILIYYACVSAEWVMWIRVAVVAIAGACLFVALQLTVLTIAGILAIGSWIFAVCIFPAILKSRRRLLLSAVGLVLVGIFIFALGYDKVGADLWSIYRKLPPGWDYDATFYHRYLRDAYPTLWPLLTLVCVVAILERPQMALLCAAIFVFVFFIMSLGHRVHMRYLYHAFPFLVVLWAIAFQSLFTATSRYILDRGDDLSAKMFSGLARRWVAFALVGLMIVFAVFSNAAFPRAVRLALGSSGGELLGDRRLDWSDAYDLVLPWAEEKALFLTSGTMISIAYIGDFDVAFSRLSVHDIGATVADSETLNSGRYIVDPRDGRPLIGTRDEVLRLIACTPVGLAISTRHERVFDDLMFLQGRDLPVEVTIEQGANIRLIGWRLLEEPNPEMCQGLPIPTDGGAAERILNGVSTPAMGPRRP
ncbi:MAG: hypothetical protein AAFU80_23980 [Pseudomonadota bacterium]